LIKSKLKAFWNRVKWFFAVWSGVGEMEQELKELVSIQKEKESLGKDIVEEKEELKDLREKKEYLRREQSIMHINWDIESDVSMMCKFGHSKKDLKVFAPQCVVSALERAKLLKDGKLDGVPVEEDNFISRWFVLSVKRKVKEVY